jgi:hypothetical protein
MSVNVELMRAYTQGILDAGIHDRLVRNLPHYARRAGIPEIMILQKLSDFGCSPEEIDYARKIKQQASKGIYGLIYLGAETTPVMTRMCAVAGACVRNFIDAKVMILQELVAELLEGDTPEHSVLLIPNFYVEGGKLKEWQLAQLLGLLYSRMAKSLQTFLYIHNWVDMKKAYGNSMALHLEKNLQSVAA